jgi:hypothetical protein
MNFGSAPAEDGEPTSSVFMHQACYIAVRTFQ